MRLPTWCSTGGLAATLLMGPGPCQTEAGAEDVYFQRVVDDPNPDPDADNQFPDFRLDGRDARVPYVILDGPGEAYLTVDPLNGRRITFRVPEAREVSGRMYFPREKGGGLRGLSFKIRPEAEPADSKATFAQAKRDYFEHLLSLDLPGAAWFRHRVREADALNLPRTRPSPMIAPRVRESGLDSTFDFFSGNRAVDENLQLDRSFEAAGARPGPGSDGAVELDSIRGITVAEMDFSARLAGRDPRLDPLAALIPADQHAVFFPGVAEALGLLARFRGDAAPALRLLDSRSIDRRDQARYERQLGVSLADLAGFPGLAATGTVAVTGSDPYLPEGTDLAVLIESESPADLAAFFRSKLDDACRANPEAVAVGGELEGLPYRGARSPDRSTCSYVATTGKVVAITNSPAQLGRIARAARGRSPSLAGQPDYRFFRDRYPIGAGDESAFLILTDAAIRRLCGPRWRIGGSRRVRASAALAEAHAANLTALVGGAAEKAKLIESPATIDLGPLHLGRSGVRSETYGTLDFLTPIVELPLDRGSEDEVRSYSRWRDTYQRNWRGFFDPIALRISARPGRVGADLSVMPLIASSDYKPFVDVVGEARLAPGSGDPHDGMLVHLVLGLDANSRLLGEARDAVAMLLGVTPDVALGWLGESVAVTVDDGPFWAQLAAASDRDKFARSRNYAFPVGIRAEVVDEGKVNRLLAALKEMARNMRMFLLEDAEHRGARFTKARWAEGPGPGVFWYSSPRALVVSLDEGTIRKAIDREIARALGIPLDRPPALLGTGLALRATTRGLQELGLESRKERLEMLRARSWANLPILNEWKRLYPDRDPAAFHEAHWGITLAEPAGGRYVWNEEWGTMESTVFGHPGRPKPSPEMLDPLGQFRFANFGLSFEDGGLRARTEIELIPPP